MIPKPILLLLSGGMDSVGLLHDLLSQGCAVQCLGFNYGQRHSSELDHAKGHCQKTGCKFTLIELLQVTDLFLRSALTDGNGSNIVPNRNAVFLHIAAGIAVSRGIETVCIACNKDDQQDFPDCRWEFIEAMNATLKTAEVGVEICAPYIGLTKWQIVQRARKHRWPIEDSISCYSGNECGECDACRKRKMALG